MKSFDIRDIEFDDTGVIDFYWPLNNKESSLIMNDVVRLMTPYITKNKNEYPELLAISLLFKWFLCEVLRVFESSVLVSRYKRDNINPLIPKNYKKVNSFHHSKQLECDFFINQAAGPSGGRPIPYFLKKIIKELVWNGPRLGLLKKYNGGIGQVLSLSPSKLPILHANKANKLLRYSSFEAWFEPIPKALIIEKENNQEALWKIIDLIEYSFENNGYRLPDSGKKFLIKWINHAKNFVSFYLNQECPKINDIRDEVWFGSGGSTIWHVIMIEKLRRKGIKVVTHDHGSGNSHHEQTPVHWVEFMHTDQFITFNKINEINRNNQFNNALIFGQNIPIIQSLNSVLEVETPKTPSRIITRSNKIKKLMYIGTAFHGETTRLRPIFHDLTYFDWQVKLLSYLKNHNLDVLYKPHPGGSTRVPNGFAESLGFRTLTKRLEDIDEDVDAYIIDFIFSSTTPTILKTDKPVFFINLGFPEILPNAIELIQKRCYYLEAIYSSDSRLNIDWKKLGKLLNNKEHQFTMDFPDLYFQNT